MGHLDEKNVGADLEIAEPEKGPTSECGEVQIAGVSLEPLGDLAETSIEGISVAAQEIISV